MGYLLCALGGFLFGVVITCFLLAKKNLETYHKISQVASDNMKKNISMAKGTYYAYLNAHSVKDTVEDKDSDDTSDEEELDEAEHNKE